MATVATRDEDRQSAAGLSAAPGRAGRPGRRLHHPALFVGGLVVVAGVVPMVVALAALRDPQWYPTLDQALVELRVRDVGEGHPPLIGLIGRIEGYGKQGSHPGPLMFWCLYPVYRLFGGSAWALQVSTAAVNLLAMLAAVGIGYRRGGRVLALGVAVTVLFLARSYGFEKLTMVWNPYIQILWWVVFLLAVWSVLCEDMAMLPVAVFAGSFCLQAHYPYLGLVAALGGLAAAAVVVSARGRNRGPDPAARRARRRWAGGSVALLVGLWAAPVVEELTNRPGNLNVLWYSIRHPSNPEMLAGDPSLGRTVRIWLAHLDLGTLVTHTWRSILPAPEAPVLPGVVLLGLWAAAAALAWRARQRHHHLIRLHLVVAAALAAGFASIHGIPGDTWDYLVLWGWGTTSVLVVATAATLATVAAEARLLPGREWIAARWPRRWRWRPLVVALTAALAVGSVAFTTDAVHARYQYNAAESAVVAGVAPSTIAALRRGDLPGGGDGRYLVRWDQDARWSGGAGFGFYDELDRHGFDVGVHERHAVHAGGDHRVLDRDDADAVIHLVVGSYYIQRWDDVPGAVQVAFYEPRTGEEIAEYRRLEHEVRVILREHERFDLVHTLDRALYLTALSNAPAEALPLLSEMLGLGIPAAVYVAPPDAQPR